MSEESTPAKRKRLEPALHVRGSLGRIKMKRDRITQHLVSQDTDAEEIRRLQKELMVVDKRISSMQGAAVRRPSAAQVIIFMCNVRFYFNCESVLFCCCRCTRCWTQYLTSVHGLYLRRRFCYTFLSPKTNQRERVKPYCATLYHEAGSGDNSQIGIFGMFLPDQSIREC